jgi:hypothetical protein
MVKPFLAVFSSTYGIRRLRRLATHKPRSSIDPMIAASREPIDEDATY